MSHIIIDRRKNTKGRSTVNRQRFIRRAKREIKEAVKKHIRDGNIGDLASGTGKKVHIPVKDLDEPTFRHGQGGQIDYVHPGNKEYTAGDRFKRPAKGGGKGGNASNDPSTDSDLFEFHLTKEEFLDLFFEDLELPDMLKRQIHTIDHFETRRAGFTVDGNPAQLDIAKSMKIAKGRRIALHGTKKKKLADLNQERDHILLELEQLDEKSKKVKILQLRLDEIQSEIAEIMSRMGKIPFVDDVDLRFRRFERTPIPATQAVVFNIMDVSASMGEWEKEMAKSFYLLMLLFLLRNYKRVSIVYIRYHTRADEVDEHEFFHGRETGGTTVSPALELTCNIIKDRYPLDQWNIYGCHISDGDNFPHDTPVAIDTMIHKLLPKMQYFAYIEIDKTGGKDSDLWGAYEKELSKYERFSMNVVTGPTEIYPVFRKLFEPRKQQRVAA